MKIVFVLPDMAGGGTERVVSLLADDFIRRGYQVAILLFAGHEIAYPLNSKVEICVAGETSGGRLSVRLRRLIRMRRFYRQNKGCYIFAFSVMGAVFSVIAAAGIPHRLLVSERNDPTKYDRQRIRNWAYGRAEKILAQTQEVKACFPDKMKNKITVIPNPLSEDVPAPCLGERKKQVVSVARLQPQKNHRLLIEAFGDFAESHPEYELHIFGIGELEGQLREQAKQAGLEEKVIFRGFSGKVLEEIQGSAMFVLSSDYEGISNSMAEAMAVGLPVIATDCPIGGSRTYIQDGVNGLLVPVGDRAALAKAMCRVADDPRFAAELSANGVKIREQYGLRQIGERVLQEAGI